MKGYNGCLIRFDLTQKTICTLKIPESSARKYLGGRGLGAKILFEELKPRIDPLGPENKLLFMTGPLNGISFPGNSRYCVIAKSPLTGLWGEAHAAGYFGPNLKWAGYDGIIVEGVSDKPVYLWIHEGEVEIRDATDLWGKTTHEAEIILKKTLECPSASVASIGVAGEKLVKFACIINDFNRAAGRTGLGAVMGSKKLKAIVVYGKRGTLEVAEKDKLKILAKSITRRLLNHAGVMNLKKYGTSSGVLSVNELGILPTKNFQMGVFEKAECISGEKMVESITKKSQTCFACPIGCIRIVEIKNGLFKGSLKDGPEYETLSSLGSLCMNSNLASIAIANHLCNLYSLDTISTGNVIAFTLECFEKGVISTKDTKNITLKWGDSDIIIDLIKKIAERKDIGNVLAEGVKNAAKSFGHGSSDFAVHTKGLEAAMHDPRGKKALGLAYATSCRGAVHLDGPHDTIFEKDNCIPELGINKKMSRFSIEGKPKITKITQDLHSVVNSMIICRFVGWPPYRPVTLTDLVNIVCYTTGWNLSIKEFMRIGERAFNLSWAFNAREGINRKDNELPSRFSQPLLEGASANQTISKKHLTKMLDEYYILRGWNPKSGLPTKEKLIELELQFALNELEAQKTF